MELGGLALDATVTVRGGPGERWAAWSVSVRDRTPGGLRLTHVAFPWIALARRPSTAILQPFGAGRVIQVRCWTRSKPTRRPPLNCVPKHSTACTIRATPSPSSWPRSAREPGSSWRRATGAAGPAVKPLATMTAGSRLALAHLGDPATVDTEVVVGGFTGDWEDAALLYREWALTQPWAARPLSMRDDVPAWLLDFTDARWSSARPVSSTTARPTRPGVRSVRAGAARP